VIVASQPARLDDAEGEVCAAVRTAPIDEAEVSRPIAKENQIFSHQPDRFGGAPIELRERGDWHPVPAEELAHRRAGTDLRQSLVLFVTQHAALYRHQPCADKPSATECDESQGLMRDSS
jgi:hypothetical protein